MDTEDFGILKGQSSPYRPYYIPSDFSYVLEQGINQNTEELYKISSNKNWRKSEHLDYFDFKNNRELFKKILYSSIVRYLCVFVVQPFETAKTILQCQYHAKLKQNENKNEINDFFEERYSISDESESIVSNESDPPYFYEPNSLTISPDLSYTSKRGIVDREGYILTPPNDHEIQFPWEINIEKTQVRAAIYALWNKEGVFGLWKAQNISFIYSILYSIIESWSSSFLSKTFSFPDFFPETIDFDHWIASFFISLTSSAFTSLLLAPIDIAKTRIMMTPRRLNSHKFLKTNLLSFSICPPTLILPTLLYSTLPNAVSLIIPIFFNKCGLVIDPYETPIMHNFTSLIAALAHLSIKLPLETILRRAQLHISNMERTLVRPGRYTGISGTIWCILHEENNKPYTLDGFYYGWRMSLYTLAGIWTLGLTSFLPSGLPPDLPIMSQ
ncbi:uncharacterized protein T551_00478 [Pneumocystis jirovecii RU7]|nr:uncharacterized protein T551_00478 [Pneumocystis jirovecii RU7]KTW32388.1 hypothetical protein T551_00478 [Pneumocystis jirovecii RU7]